MQSMHISRPTEFIEIKQFNIFFNYGIPRNIFTAAYIFNIRKEFPDTGLLAAVQLTNQGLVRIFIACVLNILCFNSLI